MGENKRRTKGTGSFKALENGKIRMRQKYTLSNGLQKVFTVTGTSKEDCEKKMRKKMAPYISGLFGSDPTHVFKRMTLTELCVQHFNEHLAEIDHLKRKSADRRESTIHNQIQPYNIGRLQVSSITPQDISAHIEQLLRSGLSVSSVIKAYDVINAAYKWAISQSFTNYNPCHAVHEKIKNRFKHLKTKNSSDGVVTVLGPNQKAQIKEFVDHQNNEPFFRRLVGLAILLLIHTGMRLGELCALRWSDWLCDDTPTLSIDKTRNVAKNRNHDQDEKKYTAAENSVKNYKARTIVLSSEANDILRLMYEISPSKSPDDYILVNRRKNASNPSNMGTDINTFYERVGLPADITGAHILRRTCATDMYYSGCRLEEIAAYLGDTPETIWKHYISITKKVLADGKVLNVIPLPTKK